ncbi:hypothetical protein ACA910_019019 [Epithemia clementina (nom. ined.)]
MSKDQQPGGLPPQLLPNPQEELLPPPPPPTRDAASTNPQELLLPPPPSSDAASTGAAKVQASEQEEQEPSDYRSCLDDEITNHSCSGGGASIPKPPTTILATTTTTTTFDGEESDAELSFSEDDDDGEISFSDDDDDDGENDHNTHVWYSSSEEEQFETQSMGSRHTCTDSTSRRSKSNCSSPGGKRASSLRPTRYTTPAAAAATKTSSSQPRQSSNVASLPGQLRIRTPTASSSESICSKTTVGSIRSFTSTGSKTTIGSVRTSASTCSKTTIGYVGTRTQPKRQCPSRHKYRKLLQLPSPDEQSWNSRTTGDDKEWEDAASVRSRRSLPCTSRRRKRRNTLAQDSFTARSSSSSWTGTKTGKAKATRPCCRSMYKLPVSSSASSSTPVPSRKHQPEQQNQRRRRYKKNDEEEEWDARSFLSLPCPSRHRPRLRSASSSLTGLSGRPKRQCLSKHNYLSASPSCLQQQEHPRQHNEYATSNPRIKAQDQQTGDNEPDTPTPTTATTVNPPMVANVVVVAGAKRRKIGPAIMFLNPAAKALLEEEERRVKQSQRAGLTTTKHSLTDQQEESGKMVEPSKGERRKRRRTCNDTTATAVTPTPLSSTTTTVENQTRRRGRPPKHALPCTTNTMGTTTTAQPAKRRGRPPKHSSPFTTIGTTRIGQPPTEQRSCPSKHPPPCNTIGTSTSAQPTKRRGRPPKHSPPGTTIGMTTTTEPTKRRGPPPKHSPPGTTIGTTTTTQPTKRRGRPPKQQALITPMVVAVGGERTINGPIHFNTADRRGSCCRKESSATTSGATSQQNQNFKKYKLRKSARLTRSVGRRTTRSMTAAGQTTMTTARTIDSGPVADSNRKPEEVGSDVEEICCGREIAVDEALAGPQVLEAEKSPNTISTTALTKSEGRTCEGASVGTAVAAATNTTANVRTASRSEKNKTKRKARVHVDGIVNSAANTTPSAPKKQRKTLTKRSNLKTASNKQRRKISAVLVRRRFRYTSTNPDGSRTKHWNEWKMLCYRDDKCFSSSRGVFNVSLARGGSLRVWANLLDKQRLLPIQEEMRSHVRFRQYRIQNVDEPRLHSMYHSKASCKVAEDGTDPMQDENLETPGYRYANITMKSRPLSDLPEITRLADELLSVCQVSEWGIGVNLICYRDGQDKMGLHADDDQGEEKIMAVMIASPLVARRVLIQTAETKGKASNADDGEIVEEQIELFLRPGDAYEMDGVMQQKYVHGVPQDTVQVGDGNQRLAIILRAGQTRWFKKDSGCPVPNLNPRPQKDPPYVFGPVAGIEYGKNYSRSELLSLRGHSASRRSVSGNATFGCDAIIVSRKRQDKLEDDCFGYLLYAVESRVGAGCLLLSAQKQEWIRVFRRCEGGKTEQQTMYRYDGLYEIIGTEHPEDMEEEKTVLFILRMRNWDPKRQTNTDPTPVQYRATLQSAAASQASQLVQDGSDKSNRERKLQLTFSSLVKREAVQACLNETAGASPIASWNYRLIPKALEIYDICSGVRVPLVRP